MEINYSKNKVLCCICIVLACFLNAKAQEVNLKIHLRGVFESKIGLLPLVGGKTILPIIEKSKIKNGDEVILTVPQDKLPGEFVVRYDYKDTEASMPYPAEEHLFINHQDIELWVNPKSCNNPDSTHFQKGEQENTIFARFSTENANRRKPIGVLQDFLMNYDNPHSAFYKNAIQEYEKRCSAYNQWVKEQARMYNTTFVSNLFLFQYIPKISWEGSETDRKWNLESHYFEGIDFSNPLLIKAADLTNWMNQYVNIYGTMSTTVALRDSLFTLAGKNAIEKAKQGHPLVYGWMVDYFYKGYESFNIAKGIQMLEPYLDDPRCLTSKKLEIEKRLQGIETIRPGVVAPDFTTKDASGNPIQFLKYKTSSRYKLVLFWSADCQHCKELVEKLYPWYLQAGGKRLMEVFAISVDDTDTEIKVWEEAKLKLPNWKHSRAERGINSPEASAYFILATPVMVLVDAKTNQIVALPDTIDQLEKAITQ